MERSLTAYRSPLYQITSFKYLGRIPEEEGGDWMLVVCNISRPRQKWARLTQILAREGADAHKLVQIYLKAAQLVILYRSDTSVMTPRMKRVLCRCPHRVACRLMGRQPRKG